MQVDLAGLLRNAASLIPSRKDDGAVRYQLEETAGHVDLVRKDPDQLGQFCRLYKLPAPIDAPGWGVSRIGGVIYQDARSRRLVDSCVAAAMQDADWIDPERAREGAYRVAHAAAVLLLGRIYDGDAELQEARRERDHLREQVENLAISRPTSIVVLTVPPTSGETKGDGL